MYNLFSKKVRFFILLTFPVVLFAQKDVTQFLGIPFDGSKSEMIQKLKDKGFTISPNKKDVLVGEFNGTNVNVYIVTNNNKVRRIAVMDAYSSSESNIRIRFNNLLKQFQNNARYLPTSDSSLEKVSIPKDENIQYEMLVNKKSYQGIFYQKTSVFDSLNIKYEALTFKLKAILEEAQKIKLEYDAFKKTNDSISKQRDTMLLNRSSELYKNLNLLKIEEESITSNKIKELDKCLNKKVWVNIYKDSGEYSIEIYYDNVYNEANGEGL